MTKEQAIRELESLVAEFIGADWWDEAAPATDDAAVLAAVLAAGGSIR